MTNEQKEKALFQIGMMKAFFHQLHLNLPREMSVVGGTAYRLENLLLQLEQEIKAQKTD